MKQGEDEGRAMTARDDDQELYECFYVALYDGLELDHEVAKDAATTCVGTLRSEAIPGPLLARLAIKRGALQEWEWTTRPNAPLYRVVES
jgi:hypothetical protein